MSDETNNQETLTTSVPYKLLVYRRELTRKKRQYLRLQKSKLELTQDLISNNGPKAADYKKDKLLQRSLEATIFKQKLKFKMAKYAEMLRKNKKLDEKTILKYLNEYYIDVRKKMDDFLQEQNKRKTDSSS